MNNNATTPTGVYSISLKMLALALIACALAPAAAQAQKKSSRAQRNISAQKKSIAFYSCPMDSEVKSKRPGKCPKCGMALRPVSAESDKAQAYASDNGHAASDEGAQGMKIPDIELLDQDGRRIRFYTDLVKGRTVAINFIFTKCTTICPPLGATFARVQKLLGEQGAHGVQLISISVDPATDTPERMKAWGAKFHAAPGWTFVTGDKPSIDELLRALSASSARREDHSPVLLIGNDARGIWTRAYGLASASRLVQIIKETIEGKAAGDATSKTSQGDANQ